MHVLPWSRSTSLGHLRVTRSRVAPVTSSMVSTIADSTRNADLEVSEDWENSTYAETEETEASDPEDPESLYGADYVSSGDIKQLQDIDGVAAAIAAAALR